MEKTKDKNLYKKIFWLFMFGNILGVILEGLWCLLKYRRWETYVVTIWGPFCLIYGFGAIIYYLLGRKFTNKKIITQFLVAALIGDIFEYFCGWLLDYGLGMKAWDYSRHFLNINGYIDLQMTLIWGFLGLIFIYVIIPKWDEFFENCNNKFLDILCIFLSIFMIINLIFSTMCITRWANRHKNIKAKNKITVYIDKKYPDKFMKNRYIEWWFIDEKN